MNRTITLAEALFDALSALADGRGLSVDEVVDAALHDYLARSAATPPTAARGLSVFVAADGVDRGLVPPYDRLGLQAAIDDSQREFDEFPPA